MRENWKIGDVAHLVLNGKIIKVDIAEQNEKITVHIAGSKTGWSLENDNILFRTKEEALKKLEQDEEEWKQEHDSKEKLIELFLDAAEDRYNESQMRVIRELIPKHFNVDIPKR